MTEELEELFAGDMPEEVMRALIRLTNVVLEDESLDAVLRLICAQALHSIRGAGAVSVTLVRDGSFETRVHTSEAARSVDDSQYKNNEGPCVDAARNSKVYEIRSMTLEERWPTFASLAAESGINSSLSVPMITGSAPLGVLNIYGFEESAFDDDDHRVANAFAHQAATLLANAVAFMDKDELSAQLHAALETRDMIGAAKGIVMEREAVSMDEAFKLLVSISQDRNIKLRDVARQLVESAGRNAPG
jgi:GAF domain-containing protein